MDWFFLLYSLGMIGCGFIVGMMIGKVREHSRLLKEIDRVSDEMDAKIEHLLNGKKRAQTYLFDKEII